MAREYGAEGGAATAAAARGSGLSMGMCDCCEDYCPCSRDTIVCVCLCFAAVAAIIALVILIAAFVFIRHLSITVEDASLTRLELVTSPVKALAYNLTVALTVRNPNWAMRVKHTKPLEADYLFDGQGFDRIWWEGTQARAKW